MTNTLTPEQKQWHCDGYLLYTLKDSGTYRKGEPVMVNEDMIRVSGDNADAVLARLQALLSLPSPPVSGERTPWLKHAQIRAVTEPRVDHTVHSVELVFETGEQSISAFMALNALKFGEAPITNEPVGVTAPRQVHSRHQWAQPGDEEHRTFILRFSDPDCREQVFTGKGAEQRAYDAWNLFSPNWNVYLFGTVPLSTSITGEKG